MGMVFQTSDVLYSLLLAQTPSAGCCFSFGMVYAQVEEKVYTHNPKRWKMNWKFWQKEGSARLPKPKELSSDLGKYLVVNLSYDPDWVWQLKVVMDLPKEGTAEFRIYDPAMAAIHGKSITDYKALDGQQGLVLFDGWYRKESREFKINDYYQAMKTEQAV